MECSPRPLQNSCRQNGPHLLSPSWEARNSLQLRRLPHPVRRTIRDSHRIPCMDERVDPLEETAIFSTLYGKSGYWEVKTAAEYPNRTVFTSYHGPSRNTHMPTRFNNGPGTFQRAMNVLLTKLKEQFAPVHFVSIVIFLRTPDEYINCVRQVLELLLHASMTLNLKKRKVFRTVWDILVAPFVLSSSI